MALDRAFTGMEGGARDPFASIDNHVYVSDGTARTGQWHLRLQVIVAATNSGKCAFTAPTAGQAIADNNAATGRIRCFFRLAAMPSGATDIRIIGFGAGAAPANGAGLLIKSTGAFAAAASSTIGTYTGGGLLTTGIWYRVELVSLITNPAAGVNTIDVTVNVYNDTTGALVGTVTASGTSTAGSTPSFAACTVGHSDTNSSTYQTDFDDIYWVIEDNGTAALPTATRIVRVEASAQGASADWTGDYRTVTELPRDTATDEQAATTNGFTTTFAHATAAALGITGIEGITAYAALKASGGAGNDAILINGVETTVATPAAYGTQPLVARDFTSYTTVQFDALEFGARNKRGVAIQLGLCYLEVLHAGTNPWLTQIAGVESWKHIVLQYTGTGTYQTISGVGFRPQVILVKKVTGVSTAGHLKLACMGGSLSKPLDATAYVVRGIMAITADGFTLGSDADVNAAGVVYQAICIQDGGQHASGYFMRSGIFIGTGIDSTDFTVLAAWQPTAVVTGIGTSLRMRTTDNVGDDTIPYSASATVTDQIQAINADGFQLGLTLNANVLQHPYFAIRTSALLAPYYNQGSFLGVGTSRTITGVGFIPEFVALKRIAAADAMWRGRSLAAHAGANSNVWSGTTTIATGITALAADGFDLGSSGSQVGQTSHWFAFAVSGIIEVTTPEVEFESADVSIGLTWVEFTDKADVLHVSSKIELPDPSTYYGGFKEHRVTSWGQIVRALSDRAGQYEGGEFSWVWSDTDRAIRAMLDAESTRVFLNRPVTVRMIDDVNRRLLATPRTMWKGLVRSYKPLSPLHFEVRVNDILASKFSSENTKSQIPTRLVTRADFPDCPTDAINKPVPIIYGDLSSGASTSAPPVVSGTAALGAFNNEGYWGAGFGHLTSLASPVTAIVATAAASGTLSADVPNGEYGVIVTAVDVNGAESDSEPYYYSGPNGARGQFADGPIPGVSVSGTQKLQVSWTASAGAVKYRVYLGWYYYGFRIQQYIEVTAPTVSCEFTTNPNWSTATDTTNITPGASLPPFGQFWYYAISAVCPDGETAKTAEIFGGSGPYRRPIRLEWLAVSGATAYKIYRRGAGGTYDRVWTISAALLAFDDDLLDTGVTYIDGAPVPAGLIPLTWVGSRADAFGFVWFAFLVCGHAVKEISDVYQAGVKVDPGNFGVTFVVPGKPGYSTYFPNTGTTQYLDINGNRYTMIFVRGPQGDAATNTSPLTITMKGIESVGDSSGTLITDLLLQYKHAVVNWILQAYLSGAWLATPVFPDDADLDQVDTISFDTASATAARRISGGYFGAFMIGQGGERVSVRDLVARFNVSADVDSGFNRKSQFFVTMMDESVTILSAAQNILDVNDVLADSFDVDPRTQDLFNRIPFFYSRDYLGKRPSGWNFETEKTDASSIADLEETKSSPDVELHMLRNTTVADDVIARRLVRSKEPPVIVRWNAGMAGLSFELGDVVALTHFQGIGAAGYVGRPLRIQRHLVDPDKFTVTLEALDVQRLFEGAFILGDTATLPAAWTGATEAQQRYGYLCDATTGFFSNGDRGKRLR